MKTVEEQVMHEARRQAQKIAYDILQPTAQLIHGASLAYAQGPNSKTVNLLMEELRVALVTELEQRLSAQIVKRIVEAAAEVPAKT